MRNLVLCITLASAAFLSGCGIDGAVPITPVKPGKLAISTTSIPGGTVGVAYNAAIAVSGGTTPYAFNASGLPSGLSISASTGAISGTPAQSAVGSAQVTITVTDAAKPSPQTATVKLNIAIAAAPPSKLTITTTSLSSGTVGVAYSGKISATGVTKPYAFNAGGLPSGLSLNASTGAISGTPAQNAAGTAQVSITVSDAA